MARKFSEYAINLVMDVLPLISLAIVALKYGSANHVFLVNLRKPTGNVDNT